MNMPEGMISLTWSHLGAEVSKMEIDIVQLAAV